MKAKNKKPSTRPLYDEHGNWVEEQSQIKGAIRKVFRFSPQMKEAMERARVELPPKLKKDGFAGKKNQVFYKCAACGNLFKTADVRVDHIAPVVPLWRKESDLSYDEIARGIFCKVSNLQVLCSTKLSKLPKGEKSCHAWKTLRENWIRDRFFELGLKVSHSDPRDWFTINKHIDLLEQQYEIHLEKQLKELREKAEKRKIREEKLQAKLNKIK